MTGKHVRNRPDFIGRDSKEKAGPRGSSEIDLAAGAVAGYDNEDSLVALDSDTIAEAGRVTQRWCP
jgi:hypothetical protein